MLPALTHSKEPYLHSLRITEVVLASLLPAFKFEPTGKPVYWNAAGVAYPSANKGSRKPELPLKVTALA